MLFYRFQLVCYYAGIYRCNELITRENSIQWNELVAYQYNECFMLSVPSLMGDVSLVTFLCFSLNLLMKIYR